MQYIQLDKIDELNKYFYPNVFEELAESNGNIKQYKINNCNISLTNNMFVFENLKTNDSVRIHNRKNKTTILLDRVCEILDFLKISMKFEKMSGIIEWEIENHEWFDKYNTKKRNLELSNIKSGMKIAAAGVYGKISNPELELTNKMFPNVNQIQEINNVHSKTSDWKNG